jgi:hypothetical protein
MVNLATFYADDHIGRLFGVSDKYSKHHSGVDINGWAGGTSIPSFVAGTIAATGSTSNFGNWVSVRFVDDGVVRFASYCHERTRPRFKIGDPVKLGADVGPLGDTGYSDGNHLHAMVSSAANPELYRGVIDPLPFILAARGGGGGGGGSTHTRKDTSMTTLYGAKQPATITKADLDFLNSLPTSGPLVVRDGLGVYALCGDSPGTLANVQLTQLDKLGNEWAADHTGFLPASYGVDQGVRWLEWPVFVARLRAYLTPLTAGGSAPIDYAKVGQAARDAIVKPA